MPGLPEAAEREGTDPLGYMRRYGAFEVPYAGQKRYEAKSRTKRDGVDIGVGPPRVGFKTPSGLLELYSETMEEWGYADEALPGYVRSQVHWSQPGPERGRALCSCRPSGSRR